MEEVLLAELNELVVQPVEEGGVALLDGGRDVAGLAQALDADAEAGVLDRPCDDLGVVGGEGVTSAVLEGLVGVGVLVVLLELDLGVVGLEVGFGGRALGDDKGLAGQLAHVGDFSRGGRDDAEGDLEVGVREVNLFGALGCDGEVREGDVDLVGGEDLGAGGGIDGDILGGDAQVGGDAVTVDDVVSGGLAVGVDVAEGGLVGEDADDDLAGFLDLLGAAVADLRTRRGGRGSGRATGACGHAEGCDHGDGGRGESKEWLLACVSGAHEGS